MFADEFKHEVGTYLTKQAKLLLGHQAAINASTYEKKTGRLTSALASTPSGSEFNVTVKYPLHIRFLDMKKGRKGKKKKRYAPIYNKYVYGYMRSDIRKKLNTIIPDIMVREFESTLIKL